MMCFFFSSNYRKQDTTTTIAHIKLTTTLSKQHNIMSYMLITIWENTDGCADHYRCATVLHLMSMLSQAFYIIIHSGIIVPGHVRQLLYGPNTIEKCFSYNECQLCNCWVKN